MYRYSVSGWHWHSGSYARLENTLVFSFAVAICTGKVRRVWFAIRTAVGIFLAIVGEIFVFFDFYNLTLIKQL